MIDNPVYTQARSGDCADYAFLSAVRNQWVDMKEGFMKDIEGIGIANVWEYLIKNKLIANYITIKSIEGVDFWLKKWQYIVAGSGKINFDCLHRLPFIQDFTGERTHNFCIIPYDHATLWKVKDSQGPDYADHGHWYIRKADYLKIKKFRIYV